MSLTFSAIGYRSGTENVFFPAAFGNGYQAGVPPAIKFTKLGSPTTFSRRWRKMGSEAARQRLSVVHEQIEQAARSLGERDSVVVQETEDLSPFDGGAALERVPLDFDEHNMI